MSIGPVLLQARESVGVIQLDLAQRIGVKQPTLSRMESGKITPNLKSIGRYVHALGGTAEIVIRVGDATWRAQI